MFEHIREDFNVHGRHMRSCPFWAMVVYRFGRWSKRVKPSLLRWILLRLYGQVHGMVSLITGIRIHSEMVVGERFHLVHGGSIQIHPDVVFGDDCGVMHHVTIGQNMNSGVPRFGSNVFIGVGAVVLGEITVGDDARIAANSLVINDVPANALAMGVPARIYPRLGQQRTHQATDSAVQT